MSKTNTLHRFLPPAARVLLTLALALALICALSISAQAATPPHHVIDNDNKGTVINVADGDTVTTNRAAITSTVDGAPIVVNAASDVSFTLKNIDLTAAEGKTVIEITGDGKCTIILDGTVKLTAEGDDTSAISSSGSCNIIIEGTADEVSSFTGGEYGIDIYDGSVTIAAGATTGAINGGECGIYTLRGSVSIAGTTDAITGVDYGIYANGDVTIAGAPGAINGGKDGIYAENGSVSIAGTTGTIEGGENGSGIYAETGSVTIAAGATTDAIKGGKYGIWAKTGVTIAGAPGAITGNGGGIYAETGSVTIAAGATTSTITGSWYGIYADGGDVKIEKNAKINGEIKGTSGDGIQADGNVTIAGETGAITGYNRGIYTNGGDVEITADAKINGAIEGTDYYGIRAENGSVTIAGTTVAITGDWYGIYASAGSVEIAAGAKINGVIEGTDYDGIRAENGSVTIAGTTVAITGRYGISATGSVEITADAKINGAIEGTGSHGIYAETGDVTIAGTTGAITGGNGGGIRAGGGDVTIEGTTGDITGGLYGIYADTDVTIAAGATTGAITGGDYGIAAHTGDVEIAGETGKITGTGEDSYGVYAETGSVTIAGTTGDIIGGKYGIYADTDVTITAGATTGEIKGTKTTSSGIYAETGSVEIAGTTGAIKGGSNGIYAITGDVTIAAGAKITGEIKGTSGYGIYAKTGSVTIAGTVASISGGESGSGVYAETGSVTIAGTTGAITGGNCGIYAITGDVKITATAKITGEIKGTVYFGISAETGSVTIAGTTGAITGGQYGIRAGGGSVSIAGTVASISGGTNAVYAKTSYAILDYGNLLDTSTLAPTSFYTVTFNYGDALEFRGPVKGYFSQNSLQIPEFTAASAEELLEGWYKEEALTNKWEFTNNPVTANITLYAKWDTASTDASLATLTVSEGTLIPALTPGTFSYTVSVANDVESIDISATATNSNAVISGDTGTRSLSVGQNIFEVTVYAEDLFTNKVYTITVTRAVPPTPPAITTASLPSGTVGKAYSQTLAATGSVPITWSIESGSLPDGLTLNADTGVISGTPLSGGKFDFTVKAANEILPDATKSLSITINTGGTNPPGGGGTTTPAQTIPAADGEVAVSFTQSGDTVTLDLPTAKVTEIINAAEGGVATFDLSGVKDASEAIIPATALKALTEAGLEVEIELPQGNVTLDGGTLATVAQSGGNMTVSLSEVKTETLTTAQKEQLKPGDVVFDISLMAGTKVIHELNGTITVTVPYDGELPVAVWYLNDAGELKKLGCSYQGGFVTFTTDHLSLYVIGQDTVWQNPFTDVAESAWYFDAVKYVYENGVMNGTGGSLFAPNVNLSRAMMVQILYNIEGRPDSGSASFDDVSSTTWYADAVAWAAENGIVNGIGNNLFDPDAAVTREQMAVMLYNYCVFKGIELPLLREDGTFADADKISSWAIDAVEEMYKAKILNGKGEDMFDPEAGATRAEVSAMLHRFAILFSDAEDAVTD